VGAGADRRGNSVVSLVYYVRVIRDMFIHEPEASAKPIP